MTQIRKRFGSTVALDGVDFEINPGEIHALIGENGAGKSTLMKIISGALTPDAGRIMFRDALFQPGNPAAARRAGVAMVYQELTLAPHLTVMANIMLGQERATGGVLRSMRTDFETVMRTLEGVSLDPGARVSDLGIGSRQMTEIARALVQRAALVVLDEPTSSLSRNEVQVLFRVIRRLASDGIAVVYISHFLEEVLEIADRYTVLRDGRTVYSGTCAGVRIPTMVDHMVGREVEELYVRAPAPTRAVTCRITIDHAVGLAAPVALEMRPGEVLGIAGLVGSGRTELLKNIFGAGRKVRGRIEFADEKGSRTWDLAHMIPGRAFAAGVGFLPEDRKIEGLATNLSLVDNQTMAFMGRFRRGVALSVRRQRMAVTEWLNRTRVKYGAVGDPVMSLSGGNQQKIMLGRLLQHGLRLLLLDEPTRGVDVGAKVEIYRLIREAAEQGAMIVVVSSYLPELFGIAHSIAVMHRGRLSQVRPVAEWSPEKVMQFATTGGVE
jgi:ribose transport system ATP-binding protein